MDDNKAKEIKDICKLICATCAEFDGCAINCKAHRDTAEALYNAGYRKLPEDSVALSKEEYDNLKLELQKAHNKGVRVGFDMTKFREQSISKKAVKEFAEKVKEEVVCNLSCKGTAINNAKEIKACLTMARQLLYRINRLLNEDYGFDKPLCASDQFKVEPELIKKYKIDELLKEYENE